jgi:hypothetical protein
LLKNSLSADVMAKTSQAGAEARRSFQCSSGPAKAVPLLQNIVFWHLSGVFPQPVMPVFLFCGEFSSLKAAAPSDSLRKCSRN